MSYKRRIKRGIPKNTNSCYSCKNRIFKPLYSYEEDTNSYYKDGQYVICKYLNVVSSDEDVFEFIMQSNLGYYTEEELNKIIRDINIANDLHYGHFTKSENYIIDEDDIPFWKIQLFALFKNIFLDFLENCFQYWNNMLI